jgi:hypothetical protein
MTPSSIRRRATRVARTAIATAPSRRCGDGRMRNVTAAGNARDLAPGDADRTPARPASAASVSAEQGSFLQGGVGDEGGRKPAGRHRTCQTHLVWIARARRLDRHAGRIPGAREMNGYIRHGDFCDAGRMPIRAVGLADASGRGRAHGLLLSLRADDQRRCVGHHEPGGVACGSVEHDRLAVHDESCERREVRDHERVTGRTAGAEDGRREVQRHAQRATSLQRRQRCPLTARVTRVRARACRT